MVWLELVFFWQVLFSATSHNHRKDGERRRVADRDSMPPYLPLNMMTLDLRIPHHGVLFMMLSRDQSVESGGQPVGNTHHD